MSKAIEILNRVFSDLYIETKKGVISEPKEGMFRNVLKGGISDDDILICRLDQDNSPGCKDLFPYLRGSSKDHGLKGMKCISDYAVFVDKGGEIYVLLMELKKGSVSPWVQLNVTEPLIYFIFERARILNHLSIDFKVRKIGITDCVDRRATSDRGEVYYDDERCAKLYLNKNIYLQHLLH